MSGRRGRRRWLWAAGFGLFAVLGLVAAVHGLRAVRAGSAGRAAIVKAEADLRSRSLAPAREALVAAEAAFARMGAELDALGPLGAVARVTPFLRVQVRGADALADAGVEVARAGLRLTDAAQAILEPPEAEQPLSNAIRQLRVAQSALAAGGEALDSATARVVALDGSRLLGPLGSARRTLRERLVAAQATVSSGQRGLAALITFLGGDGPRRYLVLSQNPDEPRPTGGFIGTYGVLVADEGRLQLDQFEDIATWTRPRPAASVPASEAPSPFRLGVAADRQTLGNVNATPDWPSSARLAMELWSRGGETPVDGVVSVLPAFLVRMLAVTGPVAVPGYGETVDATNLVGRLDFYTHGTVRPGRKDFVGAVAESVLGRVLGLPGSSWVNLADAAGQAFGAREAMVYSRDPAVQAALGERRWDGALPETFGDFFYNGEFSYAAKNGRGLRRSFDHRVELRPDGSARITTKVTIANTEPPDPAFNRDSLTYLTLYGPAGATLDPASSPGANPEPPVSGHPANGWFLAAAPGAQASVTAVWEAPSVLARQPGGSYLYGLWWVRVADHTGDVVNLTVVLPEGWAWEGPPPPARTELARDLIGTWAIRAD